uniref:Uncharacterized protein n=1 Tax=Anguilla anguilla TaxID=7936 RepID=A0A0E9SC93_ANGAN
MQPPFSLTLQSPIYVRTFSVSRLPDVKRYDYEKIKRKFDA